MENSVGVAEINKKQNPEAKSFGVRIKHLWQYKTDLQEKYKMNLPVAGVERRTEWRSGRTELQAVY